MYLKKHVKFHLDKYCQRASEEPKAELLDKEVFLYPYTE